MGGIYLFGHLGNLFLACSTAEDKLLGDYFGARSSMNLTRDCNVDCNCGIVAYNPVCAIKGDGTYFSPCHAGCESYDEVTKTFYDCSCLEQVSFEQPVGLGSCTKACGYGFLIFTLMAAVNNFLSASGRVGNTLVNYRYSTIIC